MVWTLPLSPEQLISCVRRNRNRNQKKRTVWTGLDKLGILQVGLLCIDFVCKGSFTLWNFFWLQLWFVLSQQMGCTDSMEVFILCDCDNITKSQSQIVQCEQAFILERFTNYVEIFKCKHSFISLYWICNIQNCDSWYGNSPCLLSIHEVRGLRVVSLCLWMITEHSLLSFPLHRDYTFLSNHKFPMLMSWL